MNPFLEILADHYSKLPARKLHTGECQTLQQKRCLLCHAGKIDYATELKHKQQAINKFWNSLQTGIPMRALSTSPLSRNYRTVSKRKAFLINKKFLLGLIGVEEDTARNFPLTIGECVIEPRLHSEVYRTIQEYLQKKENFSLAQEFNYVIVKGSDAEAIVIFNMNHFSSANRKEINRLSRHLTARIKNIHGVFVFVDEERSRYYLSDKPIKDERLNTKPLTKIFGKEKLFHKVDDVKFLYSALSFSQTNHSLLDSFVKTARDFLEFSKNDMLLDLYCGYGFFSLCLAKNVKRVLGIELSRSSINDAIENVQRNRITNAKFISANITADSLRRYLKRETSALKAHQPLAENLKLLLDPPRSGTAEGVIEFLANANPEKIVHIFCNADIIEKELKRWKRCGYSPAKAQPFDMFPGTSEIEVMVELEKLYA